MAGNAPVTDSRSLREQVESLRQQMTTAAGPDDLAPLLNQARTLLKSTFQTEVEADMQSLFRELRSRLQTGAAAAVRNNQTAQLIRQFQSEQVRLASVALDDREQAVEALGRLLKETGEGATASLRGQILQALEDAISADPRLRRKVLDVLEALGNPPGPDIQVLSEKLKQMPASLPPDQHAEADTKATATSTEPGIEQRLSQARRFFYAGDYYEAIDALTDILRLAPNNQEAKDRLAQVEDNIRRGTVPDSRVPFEARVAYGRAQSLERAGRFDEAREAYTYSLGEARQGGGFLQNWQPAVEALLRVENSMIAHSMRDQADGSLQAGQWREAIEKYEAVLRLLPDDEYARERLQLLRQLLERSDIVRAQFKGAGANLIETGQRILDLREAIRALRPKTLDNPQLNQLDSDLASATKTVRDRAVERSQQLVSQARYLPNVSSSRRLMSEAARLLAQARELVPGDSQVIDLDDSVREDLLRLEQVEQQFAETRRLLNLNTPTARAQAKELLERLQEYNQEPLYFQLLSNLRFQYIEQAQAALQARQMRTAGEALSDASHELFSLLGPSEEFWRADQEFRATRWRLGLRLAAGGAGIIVVIWLVVTLWWNLTPAGFAFFQTPSATPQPTQTASPTATASPTPSPTTTSTPTPTATATPTTTPTIPPTATLVLRIGAINQDSAAFLQPQDGSGWAFTLQTADPVQILDETVDLQGRTWYKILYVRGDSTLIGWARATDINVMPVVSP